MFPGAHGKFTQAALTPHERRGSLIAPRPSMHRPLSAPALLLGLALAVTAVAATTPARVIDADLAKPRGAMNRMYNFCVGAGRANEGLRADWQRQLRRARTECGFRYLRFLGLFCDDMRVYSEDKQGRPVYNWQYIDELFDFLQRIGMKP